MRRGTLILLLALAAGTLRAQQPPAALNAFVLRGQVLSDIDRMPLRCARITADRPPPALSPIALVPGAGGEWQSPEVLETLISRAARLGVAGGETRPVTLRRIRR